MFEKSLEEKFKRIFGVKKITYQQPSSMNEQEVMFIDISDARPTIKDGREKAIVRGTATMYGQADKMPFGFFAKAIQNANLSDTKDLFFSDFEMNTKYYQNLVQRDFSFVYFFDGSYDPEQGEINEVTINIEEV